jgi:RWD domain
MTAKKKNTPKLVPKADQSPVEPEHTPVAYTQGPTNYVEIQQNELSVLRSIYMEDFEEVEVKAAAWSVRLDTPSNAIFTS